MEVNGQFESVCESVFSELESQAVEALDLPMPGCFRMRSHSYVRAIEKGCSQDDECVSLRSSSPPRTTTTVRTIQSSTAAGSFLASCLGSVCPWRPSSVVPGAARDQAFCLHTHNQLQLPKQPGSGPAAFLVIPVPASQRCFQFATTTARCLPSLTRKDGRSKVCLHLPPAPCAFKCYTFKEDKHGIVHPMGVVRTDQSAVGTVLNRCSHQEDSEERALEQSLNEEKEVRKDSTARVEQQLGQLRAERSEH
ncbi:hypothetical protein NN561_012597 [Cricetulus griseus]